MAKRNRYKAPGSKVIVIGALLLVLLTAYEFKARVEMLGWVLSGLYRLCVTEGIPFGRALTYFDPSMYYLLAYMAGLILFSILAIALRRRRALSVVMLAGSIGLLILGANSFDMFAMSITNWQNTLKMIPLLAMGVGFLLNVVGGISVGGDREEREGRSQKRWRRMYEDLGMEPGEMRGGEASKLVGESRRDKRYKEELERLRG